MNSPDIISLLSQAIAQGRPVVLATVIATRRSVPRRPGTKMLVFDDGQIKGTVGGGELEHRTKLEAAQALADKKPRVMSFALVDPASGDPGVCGGEVEIYLEPFMPKPTLLIVGAGHVGQAVCDLASWIGMRAVVWDDRPDVLALATKAEVALTGSIEGALEAEPITSHTAVVIVTRNVSLDLEILPKLLATEARYIGLMGSVRRWQTTSSKLLEMGISQVDLDRVTAPIGLEISAETPEEIALSILSEVVAERRSPVDDGPVDDPA